MQHFRELALLVRRVIPFAIPDQVTPEEGERIACALKCNIFCHDQEHALKLFPVLSLLNHDCAPNASLASEGRNCSLVAQRHIVPDEEICISYTQDSDQCMTRQQFHDFFHFHCKCPGCIDKK